MASAALRRPVAPTAHVVAQEVPVPVPMDGRVTHAQWDQQQAHSAPLRPTAQLATVPMASAALRRPVATTAHVLAQEVLVPVPMDGQVTHAARDQQAQPAPLRPTAQLATVWMASAPQAQLPAQHLQLKQRLKSPWLLSVWYGRTFRVTSRQSRLP